MSTHKHKTMHGQYRGNMWGVQMKLEFETEAWSSSVNFTFLATDELGAHKIHNGMLKPSVDFHILALNTALYLTVAKIAGLHVFASRFLCFSVADTCEPHLTLS